MSALTNLKTNIPPRARLMIAISVAAVVGVVGFTYLRLSNGQEIAVSTATADVGLAPSRALVGQGKATDKILYDEDSQIGQLYKKDEEEKAEEAIVSNASHLDKLNIQIEEDRKVETVITRPPEVVTPAQSKLQALLESRREKEQQATQATEERQAKRGVMMEKSSWDDFLNSEKAFVAGMRSKMNQITSRISSNLDKVPTPEIVSNASAEQSRSTGGSSASGSKASPLSANSSSWERMLAGNNASNNEASATPTTSTGAVASNRGSFVAPASRENLNSASDYPSQRISRSMEEGSKLSGKIAAGSIYVASLQIGINTDEISPVRLRIEDEGVLKNAVVLGTPSRIGEKATVDLNIMSVCKRQFNINAVLIDPETRRTGLADNVNRHTLERYSKLFIASFVEGYAESLSSTQTTTNTDGSSSTQRDALPNSSDQVKVGIGKAGERFAPIFEREFERPPTVEVFDQKVVYLMFMNELDLGDEDCYSL